MEIKDRTWTIQACSAVTKEGKIQARRLSICRFTRRHGVACKDNFREEMRQLGL